MKILRFSIIHYLYFNFKALLKQHSLNTSHKVMSYFEEVGGILPRHFSLAMKAVGNEVVDVLVNQPFLKIWAKEHGVKFRSDQQVFEEMIAYYKPDFVYVERFYSAFQNAGFMREMKAKYPFLKGFVLWTGEPFLHKKKNLLNGFDLFLCITPKLAEQYKILNPNSYCSRYSIDSFPNQDLYEKDSLKNKTLEELQYVFTFLGQSGFRSSEHLKRFHYLDILLQKTELHAWLNEDFGDHWLNGRFKNQTSPFLSEPEFIDMISDPSNDLIRKTYYENYYYLRECIFLYYSGASEELVLERWKNSTPLCGRNFKNTHPYVSGEKYLEIIKSSQITLNIHTNEAGHAGNFRIFEAGGQGTCCLTNKAYSMPDLLDPDKHVVSFESIEEAIEKYEFLKDNPKQCLEIGHSFKKHLLKHHNIFKRAQEIHTDLSNYLKQT